MVAGKTSCVAGKTSWMAGKTSWVADKTYWVIGKTSWESEDGRGNTGRISHRVPVGLSEYGG